MKLIEHKIRVGNKYHTSELAAKINTIAWTQNNRKQRAKFMLYLGGAMELNL